MARWAALVFFSTLGACTSEEPTAADPPVDGSGAGGSGAGAGGVIDGGGGSGGQGGDPGPTSVPMFVAQGHMGRTTISCDSGQTWVADASNDDDAICWQPPNQLPDCDHDPGAGRGVAWGDGWFVATFGWGPPGGIRRSADGVTWEETLSGTTFAGVAHGNGVFVAGSNYPQRSADQGASWTALGPVGLGGNARRFGFVDVAGGLFIIAADNSTIAVSDDAGDSWSLPSVPSGCGAAIQTNGGIASGNGVILVLGGDGSACVSPDGVDWELFQIGEDITSHLVWTGSEFMAWSAGTRHASPDGETWSSTPTVPASIDIGPSAIAADGSIIAVRGGWQVWYDEQELYRSSDGITWETVPGFAGGHPIRAITFGEGAPSQLCP